MATDPNSKTLDGNQVAELLVEIGQRMELTGDSPFKARAYYTAAENLRAESRPLPDLMLRKSCALSPASARRSKKRSCACTARHASDTRISARATSGRNCRRCLLFPAWDPKKITTRFTKAISSSAPSRSWKPPVTAASPPVRDWAKRCRRRSSKASTWRAKAKASC